MAKGKKASDVPDCDSAGMPQGEAYQAIEKMAGVEEEFYWNYLLAWKFATENGHTDLQFLPESDDTVEAADLVYDCGKTNKKGWQCHKDYHCRWLTRGDPGFDEDTFDYYKDYWYGGLS